MLGELEPLRLIIGAEIEAVKSLRTFQHVLVDETADDLPVLQNERHFVAADLEHRRLPLPPADAWPKPGSKKPA